MDAKTLLKQLKSMKATPEKLPEWPLSVGIIKALTGNPKASADYIDKCLNHRYKSRVEIGQAREAFRQASGMSDGQLCNLHLKLKLKNQKTQQTLDREAMVRNTKEERLRVLEAACAVIEGYGSPQGLEDEYGVDYMRNYRLLRKLLKGENLVLEDLRAMSIPARKALSRKVEKQHRQELDKAYAYRLDD